MLSTNRLWSITTRHCPTPSARSLTSQCLVVLQLRAKVPREGRNSIRNWLTKMSGRMPRLGLEQWMSMDIPDQARASITPCLSRTMGNWNRTVGKALVSAPVLAPRVVLRTAQDEEKSQWLRLVVVQVALVGLVQVHMLLPDRHCPQSRLDPNDRLARSRMMTMTMTRWICCMRSLPRRDKHGHGTVP
ncbi:hypothetical protein BDP27DRAFT_1328825 [Rhodocollybia butyracea]|uniref:Uncharacterized protein n=1 Tax=Rhodocollybia butyracea TaxID=206335 RepID=A0A9P5U720_9AGAR|nr:hypothetical protein BDP27DRAFT_1328825 [Rhodocollybia butyracea]